MRFDDDKSVDLIDPAFTRGQLRGFETRMIEETFDQVAQVLFPVNDGKEATVYACATHANTTVAAKLYRAQKFRAFNNARQYINTSKIRNRRSAKAIEKGSRRGRQMTHTLWVDREWHALNTLYQAGASVPEPLARADFGILMEYLGEREQPAPMLSEIKVAAELAEPTWQLLMQDVECLLDCNLIHGDLSGYNVLWWQNRPRLIDLPQALDLRQEHNPFDLLHRDIANLARCFKHSGLGIDPLQVTIGLASRYL